MALKDIKAKIGATKRMNTVTRAMEAVSAVKMRKTQSAALQGRAYARAAVSILARLSGSGVVSRHPLAEKRETKRMALLLVTSDKGLAGSLNSAVLKSALRAVTGMRPEDVVVYAYGKKGMEYFSRRNFRVAKYFENKRDDVPRSEIHELARELSDGFIAGEFDTVIAVYQDFKSTFEQVPTERSLLPLSLSTLTEIVEGIRPAKGKWSVTTDVSPPASYDIEGAGEAVIEALAYRLLSAAIYHMLLESKASEHSARMVAMKSASDKSKEVARDLTRVYNKIRQAAITREVSEIVGGREALAT